MNNNVPSGYKQTEVGVIPEEWEAVLLDRVAKRGSGHTPDKKHPEYWNGNIKWISLADSTALDQGYIDDTFATITPEGIANSSAVIHIEGTVVLSRDAGVGKSAIMRSEMAVSQHFMAWRCGPELDNHYLYYWLQATKPEFERIANGSTIKTIGLPYFKELKIPLPPLPEQRAIATALSDVDALIASLDKLIAKKRDMKQAAMQELLTGKRRLPGFGGEWEVKKANQFGDIVTGGTPPTGTKEFWNGDIPWITPTDISDSKDIFVSERQITGLGLASIRRLPSNSVLVTCIASIGKNAVLRNDGACNQQINAIVPNKEHNPDFLYYLIESKKQFLLGNAGITATSIISKKDFSELLFTVPLLPEQTAIATILSDMDAEISELERKRDKTRLLKQGMMQELLTGRIRLV